MSVPNAGNYPTPFGGMFSWFYNSLGAAVSQLVSRLLQRYSGPYIVVNTVEEGGSVAS